MSFLDRFLVIRTPTKYREERSVFSKKIHELEERLQKAVDMCLHFKGGQPHQVEAFTRATKEHRSWLIERDNLERFEKLTGEGLGWLEAHRQIQREDRERDESTRVGEVMRRSERIESYQQKKAARGSE